MTEIISGSLLDELGSAAMTMHNANIYGDYDRWPALRERAERTFASVAKLLPLLASGNIPRLEGKVEASTSHEWTRKARQYALEVMCGVAPSEIWNQSHSDLFLRDQSGQPIIVDDFEITADPPGYRSEIQEFFDLC